MGPFNEQAEQPSKRPRTESAGRTDDMRSAEADSEPVADEPHTARGPRRQRTRAAMACAVCRARKTKCDGRRPSCGFCQRTSSACQYDTVVEYAPDSAFSGHQDMGPQILQAIEQLTQLVKTQQSQSQPEWANYYRGPTQSCSVDEFSPLPLSQSSDSHALLTNSRLGGGAGRLSGPPSPSHLFASSEGLDSVLQWRVFPPGIDKIPVDNGIPIPMPDELPPLSLMELTRLQMNYRRVVHDFNPMLDLATLDRYTTHIAENGLDFTTRTCLVVLVCAVGALCQEESAFTIPSRLPVTERNDDLDIAYRFWSVASRRLGRAMSHNTLESAQCLCLAGIWFMCNLQPLDAWKHFTMAGNCYYSAILARKSLASPGSQSPQLFPQAIEHSIFYTAYKSELEIRYELAIPGSVLEHLEEELVFPSPPMLSETQLEGPNDEAITWYYYLTDIAARHLINRIINTGFKIGGCPTEAQARSLLRDYKIFGSQLEDWYESLPQVISFELPKYTVTPEPNSFKYIIRARYLFIRVLLCRPFLRICLNYTLHLPEELIAEISSIASLGLQYCALRLQSAIKLTRLDHGMWSGIRSNTANALILVGAARSNHFPSLNGALRLLMPEDWRSSVQMYLDTIEPVSEETRGGMADCYKLIRLALEDFGQTAD